MLNYINEESGNDFSNYKASYHTIAEQFNLFLLVCFC